MSSPRCNGLQHFIHCAQFSSQSQRLVGWLVGPQEEVLRFILCLRLESISTTAKLCFMCISVPSLRLIVPPEVIFLRISSQTEEGSQILVKSRNMFAPSCNCLHSDSLLLPPLQKGERFWRARMTQKFVLHVGLHSEFAPWHRPPPMLFLNLVLPYL